MRRAVARLGQHPRVRVWIISGRKHADVRNRIGVAGIRYLGLHGWETRPGRGLSTLVDSSDNLLPCMKTWANRLVRETPQTWLEDKGAVLTIHYAGASPDNIRKVRAEAAKYLEPHRRAIYVFAGERSLELIPADVRDKGAAVRRLWRRALPGTLPVFVGDDAVDEPAFLALAQGITVQVGRRTPTHARYRVFSIEEVRVFLERLAQEAG
jgi:trehalose 6-phosphate phosphatase